MRHIYFLDNLVSGLNGASQEGLDAVSRTIHSKGHLKLVDVLLRARKASGLSQKDMAMLLHCQQSLVARFESGERRIDVIEFIVICRALDVRPEEIFGEII